MDGLLLVKLVSSRPVLETGHTNGRETAISRAQRWSGLLLKRNQYTARQKRHHHTRPRHQPQYSCLFLSTVQISPGRRLPRNGAAPPSGRCATSERPTASTKPSKRSTRRQAGSPLPLEYEKQTRHALDLCSTHQAAEGHARDVCCV